MTDEDIYAFRPVPPADAPMTTPRRERRWWPWLLAALLVLGLLASAMVASALLGMASHEGPGLHLQIDGNDWGDGVLIDDSGLRAGLQAHWGLALLVLTLALAAVFVVVAVIVPLALLLGLLGAALGVGVALLAVLGIAAVALSPLWLLGLLLWLLLRRRPSPA